MLSPRVLNLSQLTSLQTFPQAATFSPDQSSLKRIMFKFSSDVKNRLRSIGKRLLTLGKNQQSQSQSLLLSVTCRLARIDQAAPRENLAGSLHHIEWPVSKFQRSYRLLVPPPCTETPPETFTDIGNFTDKIPERMRAVHQKANPEKLVGLMLPEQIICPEAREIGAIFWLWLCITDGRFQPSTPLGAC